MRPSVFPSRQGLGLAHACALSCNLQSEMADSFNAGGLAVVRWRPPRQTHLLRAHDTYHSSRLAVDNMDENLSDVDYQRKHGCSRSDVRKLEEKKLREELALTFGAFQLGSYVTVGEKNAAKVLEKKEAEEARQARSDDARNNHSRWMWVKEPESGDDNLVEILLDTQSDGNFMTEEMVNDYKLQLQRLHRPETFNMAVGEVTCKYRVAVEWMGAEAAHDITEFYVLPQIDCRIEKPLLGAASMSKFQHLLLTEPPRDSKYLMYTAMKKKTKDEELRVNQIRQQAMADRAKLAEKKKTHEDTKSEKGREDGSSSKSKK